MLTLFQALRPGDHIVASDDMYFGIRVQLNEFFAPWGLHTTYVDMSDLDAVQAAMQPNTRLVILESPTNPLIRLADIPAVAEIAHAHGAQLLVDNTVATPVAQNPIALGADMVVMALTKYIAGHHDVLGGVIIFAAQDELAERGQPHRAHWRGSAFALELLAGAARLAEHGLSRSRHQRQRPAGWRHGWRNAPEIAQVLYPHHPSTSAARTGFAANARWQRLDVDSRQGRAAGGHRPGQQLAPLHQRDQASAERTALSSTASPLKKTPTRLAICCASPSAWSIPTT